MEKRRKFKLKAIVLSLATVVLFSGTVNASVIEIDRQQSQLEADQEQLEAKINQVEAELAKLEAQEDKALEYQAKLIEQINLIEERVKATMNSINALNGEIEVLEESIAKAEVDYEDTLEQLKERIKTLYKSGDVTSIEMLLDSESLQDFAYKNELLKSVSDHDQQMMAEITEFVNITKEDREDLEERKNDVAKLQIELESDKEELNNLYIENEDVIKTLEAQQVEKENVVANYEVENAEYTAQIEALIAEKVAIEEEARKQAEAAAAANGSYSDNSASASDWYGVWPVPGYGHSYITQYYGTASSWYSSGYHNGLDIGAPSMTPVVAVNSGEVLSASYNGSWGNNVLIYHNSTYTTSYAHLESFAVSAGQYVTAGQIIGYMGSTGFSTGPHLHLEVYKNGSRVDPLPYI